MRSFACDSIVTFESGDDRLSRKGKIGGRDVAMCDSVWEKSVARLRVNIMIPTLIYR